MLNSRWECSRQFFMYASTLVQKAVHGILSMRQPLLVSTISRYRGIWENLRLPDIEEYGKIQCANYVNFDLFGDFSVFPYFTELVNCCFRHAYSTPHFSFRFGLLQMTGLRYWNSVIFSVVLSRKTYLGVCWRDGKHLNTD